MSHCHIQDVHCYTRKTYKNNRRGRQEHENINNQREDNLNNEATDGSSRSERGFVADLPGCSCDPETEGEVASILHKKCPVINLAQQQLQRLLEETDKVLCDNTRCCRSIYDFVWICKEALSQNPCCCFLCMLIGAAFFIGLLLGAASCGTYLGKFKSPILTCIDNWFIREYYKNVEDTFRCIS